MAANDCSGYGNDGYGSSYTESGYPRSSGSGYGARNMQGFSYSGEMKYPKGPQNTQQGGYGGNYKYQDSSYNYGSRKDSRAQQSMFNQDYEDCNTFENTAPMSSYDNRQGYQETGTRNQGYDSYVEEKRDNRKGSWNVSSWDRGSGYASSETTTYAEPSSYQQPHNRFGYGSWGNTESRANGSGTRQAKIAPYVNKDIKFKTPPKPQQLHYCEICKISCAGYQTYKEHLEGQRHKKKELTGSAQTPTKGVVSQLHCQLCDISCTGPDAYNAHIKGAKHLKVVKLHTRLGKPIPDSESMASESTATCTSASVKQLASTSSGMQNLENFSSNEIPPNAEFYPKETSAVPSISSKKSQEMEEVRGDSSDMLYDNSAQPVGENFVEEVRNEEGKIIRFHCKLCECSFNDSNARDMHLKGRRHRLQFKKKVNPRLPVDVKPSNRSWKMQEDRGWRRWEQKQAMQRYLEEEKMWLMEMRRYEDMYRRELEEEYLMWEYHQMRQMHLDWAPMGRGVPRYPRYNVPQVKESKEDGYVMRKHAQIYPTQKELQSIQKTVVLSEKAFKLVSECIKEEARGSSKSESACLLRGVKRVGILANGLILRGNQDLQLTLMCSRKPTCSLLKRIAEILPEVLEKLNKKQHSVTYNIDEAQLLLSFTDEPKLNFTIFLTNPDLRVKTSEKKNHVEKEKENVEGVEAMEKDNVETVDMEKEALVSVETEKETLGSVETEKETVESVETEKENVEKDCPPSEEIFLNEEKCKESLLRLHRAHWFQAHLTNLDPSVIILRILHDLRKREPVWKALSDWALDVIVEKAYGSSSVPLSPADALRRVFECIASGVLFPDGPGLKDPCHKEPRDVTESLTNQEREDITKYAQQAIRLISFRYIHKVLGMEPLRSTRPNVHKRKRPVDSNDIAKGEGKKDKKEKVENPENPETAPPAE